MSSNPAPAPPAAPAAGAREFKREMTLFDSMMIVMGAMIGSGIFIVSADIARTVGSRGYLLLVWLITGVVTIIGALSYGELAGMMPHAGGLYVYLREAYNPLTGFLYGWTTFLVIQTGTIAAVGVAFAKFTGLLIPWFREDHVLLTVLGLKVSAAQLLAIASIVVLTTLNMRGLRTGKTIQGLFTVTKTVALSGLILLGFIFGANAAAIKANLAVFWKASWTHLASGGGIASVRISFGPDGPGRDRGGHGRLALRLGRVVHRDLHRRGGQEPQAEHPSEPGPRGRASSSSSISWPTSPTSRSCPSRAARRRPTSWDGGSSSPRPTGSARRPRR